MHTIFVKKKTTKNTKKQKKTVAILKFSIKFQTKLEYESNLKHSSSRSII